METLKIESSAFQQIMERLDQLEGRIKSNSRPLTETWLDNQDVCQLLHVSKRTLQHYRDNGQLPYAHLGAKIYYKASDIEKHLNNHYKS